MNGRLRIFFPISFDLYQKWRGGYHLILGALRALPAERVEIEFLCIYPTIPAQPQFDTLGRTEICENPDQAIEFLQTRIHGAGRKNSILLSLGHCGLWPSAIKRVIYIPDFQHEFLPQNFSTEELSDRKLGYQIETATADAVWVSSLTVQKDLKKFTTHVPQRQLVLPFPSLKEKELGRLHPPLISGPFILCVSQNWPHKNLNRLLEAWDRLLEPAAAPWTLVLAGKGIPSEFEKRRNCKVFPDIEEPELQWLYSQAQFFILPTLFEGWSTPVEEAISASLPLVLADLPILREQARTGSIFFNPLDIDEIQKIISQLICAPAALKRLKLSVSKNRRLSSAEYGMKLFRFLQGLCA